MALSKASTRALVDMSLLSHGGEVAAVLLGLASVGIPSARAPPRAIAVRALVLPRRRRTRPETSKLTTRKTAMLTSSSQVGKVPPLARPKPMLVARTGWVPRHP